MSDIVKYIYQTGKEQAGYLGKENQSTNFWLYVP